jgi:DNA-directed RNA polymerase subunit K/omega
MSDDGTEDNTRDMDAEADSDTESGLDLCLPYFLRDHVPEEAVVIRRAENACATKFEQAQIIGFRASELAQGAEPRARPDGPGLAVGVFDPLKIAAAEFDAGVITGIDIIRRKPDGTRVAIDIADLPRARLRFRPW